jgi:hypothetical protein
MAYTFESDQLNLDSIPNIADVIHCTQEAFVEELISRVGTRVMTFPAEVIADLAYHSAIVLRGGLDSPYEAPGLYLWAVKTANRRFL